MFNATTNQFAQTAQQSKEVIARSMHNDDALHPGMEVVITGLKGDQSLNGEHGIVKPEVEWRDGRVAVRLTNVKPSRQVAVNPRISSRARRRATFAWRAVVTLMSFWRSAVRPCGAWPT